METLQSRVNNFLRNYDFYTNSVDFRIISSSALEKFKNVQAFQLNEIRNGKYKFGKSRRELLLLKFDLLTRFLHEVENICIQCYHTDPNCSAYIIKSVENILKKSRDVYERIVFDEYPEHFDQRFSSIWLQIQSTMMILTEKVNNMSGVSLEAFYTNLVNDLTSWLQNCTMELYELDSHMMKTGHIYQEDSGSSLELIQKKEREDEGVTQCISGLPDGCGSCYMLVISNQTNTDRTCALNHLRNKIQVYLDNFNIKNIFFKNLSDSPLHPEVIKLVESFGVPIDYRRSLII